MSLIDDLGNRMKGYEEVSNVVLTRRMPLIIRLDGKAFHSYTNGCLRPFDEKLSNAMIDATIMLLNTLQGAQIAYTQSDEISILVHGYKKITSQLNIKNLNISSSV